MEQLINKLQKKAEKHLNKIDQHTRVKNDLEVEYNALNGNSKRRERVSEQLLTTYKGIEYHQGSAKTYLKVIDLLKLEK